MDEERIRKGAGKLYYDWVGENRPRGRRPVFHDGKWKPMNEMLREINYGRSPGLRRHAAGWMVYVQLDGKPTYVGSRKTAAEAIDLKKRYRPSWVSDEKWVELCNRWAVMAMELDLGLSPEKVP